MSIPASIFMIVIPVVESPALKAACTGEAPRQRGSSEAWTFRQPKRGKSRSGSTEDLPKGGHDDQVRAPSRPVPPWRRGAQARRLEHRQPQAEGGCLDRRRRQDAARDRQVDPAA